MSGLGQPFQVQNKGTSGPTKLITSHPRLTTVTPQNRLESHGQNHPKSKPEVSVAPQKRIRLIDHWYKQTNSTNQCVESFLLVTTSLCFESISMFTDVPQHYLTIDTNSTNQCVESFPLVSTSLCFESISMFTDVPQHYLTIDTASCDDVRISWTKLEGIDIVRGF